MKLWAVEHFVNISTTFLSSLLGGCNSKATANPPKSDDKNVQPRKRTRSQKLRIKINRKSWNHSWDRIVVFLHLHMFSKHISFFNFCIMVEYTSPAEPGGQILAEKEAKSVSSNVPSKTTSWIWGKYILLSQDHSWLNIFKNSTKVRVGLPAMPGGKYFTSPELCITPAMSRCIQFSQVTNS